MWKPPAAAGGEGGCEGRTPGAAPALLISSYMPIIAEKTPDVHSRAFMPRSNIGGIQLPEALGLPPHLLCHAIEGEQR